MAVSTSKSGGIYIEINGNPQPLYKVLEGVKHQSSSIAKQITGDFKGALSNADVSKSINAISASFAQLRAGVKASQADFGSYEKKFQALAGKLGLAGEQAKAFSASMTAALKKQNESNVVAALRAIQRQTGMTTAEMNKLAKSMGVVGGQFTKATREAKGLCISLKDIGKGAGLGFALNVASPLIDAVRQLTDVRELLNSMMRMDTLKVSYSSIFGGAEAGAAQLDHIYEVSQRLGLNFQSAAEGAKGFFAASKGTTLEQDATRIFESVSTAAQALHLSQEDVSGVFLALGQMVSKGKVSMEELRKQLGERLPGAFQLAAKAMGMTTDELDKAVSSGKVMAEDLLPKLADALRNRYAAAAEEASQSVQSAVNRMTTEWEKFKASVLNSDAVIATLNAVTGALQSFNAASEKASLLSRAEASLKSRGVKPQGVYSEMDFTGYAYEKSTYAYTLQQLEDEAASLKAVDVLTANIKKNVQGIGAAEEKAAGEARKALQEHQKAVDKLLKKTEGGKRDALLAQKKSLQDYMNANDLTMTQEDLKRTSAAIDEIDRQLSALGKKGSKGGGGGLANRQFKFDTGLEQLRQEVENMEAVLDPAAQGIERMRQKLELERQNAIAAAEAHAKLSVQRKEATPEEAEERKALEIRKAELTYAQKLGEVEAKNRDVRVRFYQDLARLSGNYTESIRLQTEALREQAKEFEGAGIAPKIVKQWEELKKLEMARDPFSGMIRGLQKYSAEATDLGSQLESVVTSAFSGMEDAFVKFATTGKLSFTDLANSIISDLARIAIRATITGPLASGIGSLFSGLFGGGSMSSGIHSSIMSGFSAGLASAHGNVVSGGTISDYANSIVDTPTFFNLGNRITAFARGAGVMGEAGAEAIMPLRRGSDGRLGVEMHGDGGDHPQGGNVQVNIINSTGEQVSQQTRTDNYGNKTIDVMIGDAAAAQAQKPGSRLNKVMRGITGTQQQVVRR